MKQCTYVVCRTPQASGIRIQYTGIRENCKEIACRKFPLFNHVKSLYNNVRADKYSTPDMVMIRQKGEVRTMNRDRGKGAAAMVVISAMLWGTYGSFVTAISARGMSGNPLVFLRFLATAVPVLGYILWKSPGDLRVKREDLWLFLANGIVSILFFTSCYTAAIREMKIATAAALLYTSPAMVMFFSALFFHERIGKKKVICVFAAILGCAFVSGLGGGGLSVSFRGLLLGLGSALGYALYSIFSRMIQERGYSVMTNVVYTFSIATACYLLLSVFQGQIAEVWHLPAATGLGIVCGLLTGTMAYVLYTTGLEHMEPSRAAQLATIEPAFAAVLGVVLFGQRLAPAEILGIAMILGAVIWMNTGGKR